MPHNLPRILYKQACKVGSYPSIGEALNIVTIHSKALREMANAVSLFSFIENKKLVAKGKHIGYDE